MEQVFFLAFLEKLPQGSVLHRDKTAIDQELDIYIPSLSLAFEPGSWALHKDRIWKDREKRELCDNAGIELWLIYDMYMEDTPPFERNCIVFQEDFNRANYAHLWKTTQQLLEIAGIREGFSDSEKHAIEARAYEASKSITHDDFVARMKELHPNISVCGKYVNANARVEVVCNVCGNRWNGVPANMLAGDGCWRCGCKARGEAQKTSFDEYLARLAEVNPDIAIKRESYDGSCSRVQATCKKCGTTWWPVAKTLVRKSPCGCPNCRKSEKLKKSAEKCAERLYSTKPNLRIAGHYTTADTKLLHICKICGAEWLTTPRTAIKSVHCCPNWASHPRQDTANSYDGPSAVNGLSHANPQS